MLGCVVNATCCNMCCVLHCVAVCAVCSSLLPQYCITFSISTPRASLEIRWGIMMENTQTIPLSEGVQPIVGDGIKRQRSEGSCISDFFLLFL